ncbi:long-chain fatty acid--CoA ligase [Solihabitans fulvus]|uniref:Acyl-CoA synthetase n=1 Tax=Solihabitans fulvus TaxID=1892852 RepID=A0A5B2X105_9PSEU|nr:AMP-dependent synthetase/ligase [Solihabitans fulvus]KAA2256719.1 long-chain fatty acid--CoA ligase [Solihabitans fulvus]
MLDSETLATFAEAAARRHGEAIAVRTSRPGRWPRLSYAELAEVVRRVAGGLLALGVEQGERVAILAETRPEWTVVDLAVAAVGAVSVPVYPTNSPEECRWVLTDSGAGVLVCEDAAQAAKVAPLRPGLPRLRHVLTMTSAGLGGLLDRAGTVPAAELDRRAAGVRPADLATIIYTSGTTGDPKGCLITHANWAASLRALDAVVPVTAGATVYLYLPLAHMLARVVQLDTLRRGAVLHLFGGDIRSVVPELAQVRPQFLPSVPRLFEKVHARVLTVLEQASAADRAEFRAALALGRAVRSALDRGETVAPQRMREFAEVDGKWLQLVRAAFGGRLEQALTGAAPIAPEVLEFFHACGVPVNEGYGMTETTAVLTLNRAGARRFGTVGRPVDGVRIRIAPDGEVLAKGDNIFGGYHRNAAATAEALADGWLRTGDLGEVDGDGYLRITGRKKDLIITAAGKNLSPANIENDLRQCRWIANAVLHGDRRPYPVALITLDAEEIVGWARERGLPADVEELAAHPVVRRLIQDETDRVNARYARPERIRRFALLGNDFTVASGELTPSLKVRRAVVDARYRDVLDALYAD